MRVNRINILLLSLNEGMNSDITTEIVRGKAEQFKLLGLSSVEQAWISDILDSAVLAVSKNSNIHKSPIWKTMKNSYLPNFDSIFHGLPWAVIYKINSPYIIANSYSIEGNIFLPEDELPETFQTPSRINYFSSDEILNSSTASLNGHTSNSKIELLKKVSLNILSESVLKLIYVGLELLLLVFVFQSISTYL